VKPSVLLGSSHRWALAARLGMAFKGHGCEVSAVCAEGHPLRFVSGLNDIYSYSTFTPLKSLKAAIEDANPLMIVPCDDLVVSQLYALHAEEPSLRKLIEFSLGNPETWPILQSRARLMETANSIGIRTPKNCVVEAEGQIAAWPDESVVLKRDGSLGGRGVAIAHNRKDAINEYRKISSKIKLVSAIKRHLIDRDAHAYWVWRRQSEAIVTMQEFIPGNPANTMIVCNGGEVLASITVEVLRTTGETGAASVVRLIENEEIEMASCRLAKKLMLHGFHGLDFMIARGDDEHPRGAAYLIELNSRCTQLGHLNLHGRGDLAGHLSNMMFDAIGAKAPSLNTTRELFKGETVALFPQAVRTNPNNPYIKTGYHDVPAGQPALVQELMQEIWPHRQWTSRLYHRLFPSVAAKEVQYDGELVHQ